MKIKDLRAFLNDADAGFLDVEIEGFRTDSMGTELRISDSDFALLSKGVVCVLEVGYFDAYDRLSFARSFNDVDVLVYTMVPKLDGPDRKQCGLFDFSNGKFSLAEPAKQVA